MSPAIVRIYDGEILEREFDEPIAMLTSWPGADNRWEMAIVEPCFARKLGSLRRITISRASGFVDTLPEAMLVSYRDVGGAFETRWSGRDAIRSVSEKP